MSKTLKIAIASTKGGVGKTTIAVNLAVALSVAGYKTLLFELDSINSGISYYLGTIENGSELKTYKPTGLDYFPAKVSEDADIDMSARLDSTLKKSEYDIAIIDTPPSSKRVLDYGFDAALVIINPDEQSCAAGILTKDLLESNNAKCNVLLNRSIQKPYALSEGEIEEIFGAPLIATINEDPNVMKNLASHIPDYLSTETQGFNSQIEKVAKVYAAMVDEDYAQRFQKSEKSLKAIRNGIKKSLKK